MAKTKWSKEIPKEDGWYWVKYRHNNQTNLRPGEVTHMPTGWVHVSVAGSGSFTNLTRTLNGYENAKFWSERIEVPSCR